MKWHNFKVTVRFIASGAESKITVRALSQKDALWRAINRSLDSRYEAVSAERME
jgi:hypothetical protein